MRVSNLRARVYMSTVGLMLLVALAVAACASGSSGANSTPTAPIAGGSGTAGASGTAAVLPSTATPTSSVASPGAGQGGSDEFCSNPPDVEISLPTSIPPYPNTQLRVSKVDTQYNTGNKLFVYCTADSTSAAVNFYLAQLPTKGWQQITHNSIMTTEQIQAGKSGSQIMITIQPDPVLSNTTEIVIEASGV